MQRQPRAFTTTYNGITRELINDVYIAGAIDPSSLTTPPKPQDIGAKKFVALWDTGATGTVISQKVVDACGLKPIGMAKVDTASQTDVLTPVYFASIFLPNNIIIPQLEMIRGIVAGTAEVLIGMNIISQGDFAVTNLSNKTLFTFRMPSIETIDFVRKPPALQISRPPNKIGRNDPCPCGSGKKYKKCCGR